MDCQITFSTHTDQRWQIAHDTAVLAAAGCIGIILILLGFRDSGQVVLGFYGFAALINSVWIVPRQNIHLAFTGSSLCIFHPRRPDSTITDIPAHHFVCKQNFLERKFNIGRIHIANTQLALYGVQNYAETCRYILENFPNFSVQYTKESKNPGDSHASVRTGSE